MEEWTVRGGVTGGMDCSGGLVERLVEWTVVEGWWRGWWNGL